jgi:hypothetical protein
MRLARVVVRLAEGDKEAIDRLRDRYFAETRQGLSRAAVLRAVVHRLLANADEQKATEVLRAPEVAASTIRACPPQRAAGAA